MRNNLKVKDQPILNDEQISNFKQANEDFKKSVKDSENFDHFYSNTSPRHIKQETLPPKGSLSELVYNNKLKELEDLLKSDEVNPDMRDGVGATSSWTPLYWSVKYKNIDCAKLLLSYGADINMVINDFEECCGTVLDLATLRGDDDMESILRDFAEKDDINLSLTFKAIRTKLRGKAPAFYFNGYSKKKSDE